MKYVYTTNILIFTIFLIICFSQTHQVHKSELEVLRSKSNRNNKNLKNFIKKSKKKVKSKNIKYKIVEKKNLQINITKKLFIKYSFYKKCSVKTGFVNLIQERPLSQNNYTIKVSPIFAKININNFSLFISYKSKKPLFIIPLKDIQRIDKHYLNTFCFDIIISKLNKSFQFSKGALSLCSNSLHEMQKWVKSILEFKQCQISNELVDHNQLIIDFDNVNKAKSQQSSLSKHYQLSDLYYNGKDKIRKKTRMTTNTSRTINKAFRKLMSSITRGNLAKENIRRIFRGKLAKARNFRQNVSTREYFLKSHITRKINQERDKELRILERINSPKTLQLLSSAVTQIEEFKREEVEHYIKSFKLQISKEKSEANNQAKAMMGMVMEEDKLTDYSMCYDSKLKGFKNKEFITGLCRQYYGLYKGDVCETKASFCQMCCEFNIGLNYAEKRIQCRLNCGKVIKGKKLKKVNHKKSNDSNTQKNKGKKNKQTKKIKKQNKMKKMKNKKKIRKHNKNKQTKKKQNKNKKIKNKKKKLINKEDIIKIKKDMKNKKQRYNTLKNKLKKKKTKTKKKIQKDKKKNFKKAIIIKNNKFNKLKKKNLQINEEKITKNEINSISNMLLK